MTFDKLIKEIKNNDDFGEYCGSTLDLIGSIVRLKQEYAPTIKMTRQQAKIFASYYHPEKSIRKDEFDFPDALLMKDISEKELTQAWLNPETIRITEEKQ